MNKRWLAAPLAMFCAVNIMPFTVLFDALERPVKATTTQTTDLVAKANCSAADRDRTTPPFRCVTPSAFSCLKRNHTGGGGSLDYRGDTSGEIVVKSSVVGTVALLGFRFDAASETLNLTIKKRNFGVQDQQLWDGFKNTLSKCR